MICAFGLFLPLLPALAQSNPQLQLADALYRKKQYTQSFKIYDSLLQHHAYTPAMLLKMAYIQEGLEAIAKSQYYLNLYYLTTYDRAALDRMEEMAAKYNLKGYQQSDATFFYMFFDRYRIPLTLTLLAVCVLLLAVIISRRQQTIQRRMSAFAGLVLISLLLLFIINIRARPVPVIVAAPHTYLMAEPSAGSSVVGVIGEGNRLMIHGSTDVWLRVSWNGTPAYINRNKVMEVRL